MSAVGCLRPGRGRGLARGCCRRTHPAHGCARLVAIGGEIGHHDGVLRIVERIGGELAAVGAERDHLLGGERGPDAVTCQAPGTTDLRRCRGRLGTTTLVVLLGVDDLGFRPVRALTVALIFSWPAVPAVLAQRPSAPRRAKALAWVGYVLLVLAVPVVFAGLPIGQAVLLVVLSVGISAVWAVATGARLVRGAAWIAALALVALTLVALQWYVVWLYVDTGVPLDATALAHLGGGAVSIGLLFGYTAGLVWSFRAKLVGEQTLLIMQWWFVAGMGIVLDLASVHGATGLLGLAPLLVAATVVVVGNAVVPLHREAPAGCSCSGRSAVGPGAPACCAG